MPNDECTLYCGNLSEEVTKDLLFELFLQAGPVEEVRIPDGNGRKRNFGFIVFKHECSVAYAEKLMQDTELFGRKLDVRPSVHNGIADSPYNAPSVKDRLGPKIDSLSLRGLGNDFRKRRTDGAMIPDNLKKRFDSPPGPVDPYLIRQLENAQQMFLSPMGGYSGGFGNHQNQVFDSYNMYGPPLSMGSRYSSYGDRNRNISYGMESRNHSRSRNEHNDSYRNNNEGRRQHSEPYSRHRRDIWNDRRHEAY